MKTSTLINEFREGLNFLETQFFEKERLSAKAALQLAVSLAAKHPFVGLLPVQGGGTNRDFKLTGMIIENITIVPKSSIEAQISIEFKDPDSYHKDFFLDSAVNAAAAAVEDELGKILTESRL